MKNNLFVDRNIKPVGENKLYTLDLPEEPVYTHKCNLCGSKYTQEEMDKKVVDTCSCQLGLKAGGYDKSFRVYKPTTNPNF